MTGKWRGGRAGRSGAEKTVAVYAKESAGTISGIFPAPASSSPTVRVALAFILATMALILIQDYYDFFSLYFTVTFILLLAGAIAAIFLVRPSPSVGTESRFDENRFVTSSVLWVLPGLLFTLSCAALTCRADLHSRLLVSTVLAKGALCSSAMLASRRVPLRAAALPAISSYIFMVSSPVPYMEHEFYPRRDTLMYAAIHLSYALAVFASIPKLRPTLALTAYLMAGTALKALGIYQWEIDPAHRDMVPLIHNAALSLLNGRNPYRIYYCGHDLPLTYLPILWLSYLPAVALGLEPRIVSLLLTLASALFIYLWKGHSKQNEELLLVLSAVFYMHSEVLWTIVFAESPPYWLATIMFFWAVLERRRLLASLFLGLMIASRHFSILFLPFAGIWFMKKGETASSHGKLELGGLWYLAFCCALALFVTVPFIAKDAYSFYFGTLHWLVNFGPTHRDWWNFQISLSPLFYAADCEKLLRWVQVASYLAVVAVFFVAALRYSWPLATVQRYGWLLLTISYSLFLLLNSLVWRHLYVMVFLLLFFSLVASLRAWEEPVSAGPLLPAWTGRQPLLARLVGGAIVAVLVVGGIIVGIGFYRFLDRRGVGEEAAKIAQELRPGDLLVDYSYINAMPIPEGTPFDRSAFPEGLVHSLRLRAQAPPLYERLVLVTSGAHFAFPRDLPDVSQYMELVSSRSYGKLKAYFLKNPYWGKLAVRLSDDLEWVKNAFITMDNRTIVGEKVEDGFRFPGLDPRYRVSVGALTVHFADRKCLFAMPPKGGSMHLEVEIPIEGKAWIMTAIPDFALWPALGTVEVGFSSDQTRATFTNPEELGLYFWYAGHLRADEVARLTVRSNRKKMRFFCLDLLLTSQENATPSKKGDLSGKLPISEERRSFP